MPAIVVAQEERFNISRFDVVGNRLISKQEIARLVAPFIGRNKNFGDIQRALEAIENAYRERGYGSVQVLLPEQELTQGFVVMRVVESRVGDISVQGNKHFDKANILNSLPALRAGQAPNARALSENVQLANENPAKKIDLVLGVGSDSERIDARVDVRDEKPLFFALSADNTGNSQTGRDRVGLAVQYANLFNRDQVITAAYTTSLSAPERTKIYSLSYRLPIYTWGDSVDVIVGYSDVDAGTSATVAGPLQFSGRGRVYGLRYNQMLPRLGEYSHRVIYGLDQREFDNTCTIAGSAVCGAGGADVTVRPVSLTYAGQWDSPGQTTAFQGTFATNIPGGPHGNQEAFSLARQNASARFTAFRGNLTHGRAFANDWQIRTALAFQQTGNALVSGEQFGLAGSLGVRGFQERAVTADKGLQGTFELYTPDIAKRYGLSGNLRFLGFVDVGSGSFNKGAPGLYNRETISSVGVGVRYTLGRQTTVRVDTARVTNAGPVGTAAVGDWRGHIGINLGF